MKRAASKEKRGSSGRSRSYLQTRIRASRLQNTARLLAFIELSRRLHQAYRQAYDKQAADWLLPQNTASTQLRDYAFGLLGNKISDCERLVRIVQKAGELYPHQMLPRGDVDPNPRPVVQAIFSTLTEYSAISISGQRTPSDRNYRVGVISTDPYYGGGFGQSGFRSQFLDSTPGSQNQVRHFAGWFAAGYYFGDYGRVRDQLYRAEGTTNPNDPDVALGLVGIQIGASFGGNRTQLARDIWSKVCGGSGDPPKP